MQRCDDLLRCTGGGELVEQVVGYPRGYRRGIAEGAKLSELRLAVEWRELRGDALAEQHAGDDLASVPAVGVYAALYEDGDAMRVGAAGGGAALLDALARPTDVNGRGRLCEDSSVRAATGGPQPKRATNAENHRRSRTQPVPQVAGLP